MTRRPPVARAIAAGLIAVVALGAGLIALLTGGSPEPEGASADRVVQPAAPGEGVREVSGDELDELDVTHTDADVQFMQDMIHHHQQALTMTSLVEARSDSEEIDLLAGRIEVSQQAEIELMAAWLEARGEEVPDVHALYEGGAEHDHSEHDHGLGDGELMPGMLTEAQLTRLGAAEKGQFDRLFCRQMIQHHAGALVMVDELRAAGGGSEPESYRTSAEIEADQRIEIRRMRELLRAGIGEAAG